MELVAGHDGKTRFHGRQENNYWSVSGHEKAEIPIQIGNGRIQWVRTTSVGPSHELFLRSANR